MKNDALCPDCGAKLPTDSDNPVCLTCIIGGTIRYFGDYELLGELGRGGMGVVYRARQISLNRLVAVKTMRTDGPLASHPEGARRFRNEAEAAASLDHPNIVPVYEVGTHDGFHFLSMKLIEGVTLADWCSSASGEIDTRAETQLETSNAETRPNLRRLPLRSPREIASTLSRIARAVHFAHQRGVLHRDLKPANILVDHAGEVYVTDFGVAKLMNADSHATATGQILGTPAYMAPEQALGAQRSITTAADVYSLGAILYQSLAGQPPFGGETPVEVLRRATSEEPIPLRQLVPDIDIDLATICHKCLQKSPGGRYLSAEALADDLDRWLRGEPIQARPVQPWERGVKWVRRHPLVATLLMTILVVISAAAWGLAGQARKTEKANRALLTRQAESWLSGGDTSRGLAQLARLLRENPRDHIVAERLVSALTYKNYPHAVWDETIGTGGSVPYATFSPDGRVLAASTEGGSFHLWEQASFRSIGVFETNVAANRPLRFSADGRFLAVITPDHVSLWEPKEGRLLNTIAMPGIRDLDFSPDGTQLAVAREESGEIWILSTANGKPVYGNPLKHGPKALRVRYCEQGSKLVTLSDQTLALWDSATGRLLRPGGASGESIGESADLLTTATSSTYFTVGRYNVPSGRRSMSSQSQVHFYGSGGRRATNTIVFDAWHPAACLSPDGAQILTFATFDSPDRIVPQLWSSTKEDIAILLEGHQNRLHGAVFSPEGLRILTYSRDATARIWSSRDGKQITEPLLHASSVSSAEFHPDGNYVVTTTVDGRVHVWDVLPSSAQAPRFYCGDLGRPGAAVTKNGKHILAWGGDAKGGAPLDQKTGVRTGIYGTEDLKLMRTFGAGAGKRFYNAALSSDGSKVLELGSEEAQLWDGGTGEKLALLPHLENLSVKSAIFSPDGQWVWTISFNQYGPPIGPSSAAFLWQLDTASPATRWISGDPLMMYKVCFRPDSHGFVGFGGISNEVAQVWQLEHESGWSPTVRLKHPNAGIASACFDQKGDRIVTASTDGIAIIWNARTGKMIQRMKHEGPLISACFSPDGASILTASEDLSVRVWDVVTGKMRFERLVHADAVKTAMFSLDGSMVLTVDGKGRSRIWDSAGGLPISETFSGSLGPKFGAEFLAGDVPAVAIQGQDVTFWETPSLRELMPVWLAPLAEEIAHARLDADHVLEPLCVTSLSQMRETLAAGNGQDYMSKWGRWFSSDRAERSVSPSFKVPMSQHIESLLAQGDAKSLESIMLLEPTHAVAHARLAKLLLEAPESNSQLKRVDFLSRRAVRLAPDDQEIVRIRKAVQSVIDTKQ